MAKTKTSNTVKDRYNRKVYDDLRIRLPKGQRATVQQAADSAGESVNEYTSRALLQRIGLDEWPQADSTKEEKTAPPLPCLSMDQAPGRGSTAKASCIRNRQGSR